jgi:hypothetical protein
MKNSTTEKEKCTCRFIEKDLRGDVYDPMKKQKAEGKEIIIDNIAIPDRTEDALEYYPFYINHCIGQKGFMLSPTSYFNAYLARKYGDGTERHEESMRVARTYPFTRWLMDMTHFYNMMVVEFNQLKKSL